MRLLIVTQVVDKNDPLLGFFHTWLGTFAKEFDKITVICLREGEHSLPANVSVHNLGKSASVPHSYTNFAYVPRRLRYISVFLYLILKYRHSYDCVYVHMNEEYVLLSGLLWRLWGKYVTMWRNHYAGSWRTDLAARLCHKVFCTSKYSYTAKYKKTVFMPVGVSTELFTPEGPEQRVPRSILSFGRISPSKKLDVFIEALGMLHVNNVPFMATICGDTLPEHEVYAAGLRAEVHALGIEKYVTWRAGIPYAEAPALYRAHDIFVNQSPSGMFDKTIFEAMACETLALSCNENLRGVIGDALLFREDDATELALKLEQLIALPRDERERLAQELHAYAESNHSLRSLALRLHEELRGH